MTLHMAIVRAMTLILFSYVLRIEGVSGQLCASQDVISPTANIIYIRDIPEDYPIGTALRRLNFTGTDSEIALQNISYSEFLYLDASTRQLLVGQQLEVTTKNFGQIQFNISCTVKISGTVNIYSIYIGLVDTNNHPPQFLDAPYSLNISELTPVGTRLIGSIAATDADPSDAGYLGFYIADGPYSDGFAFTSLTVGEIVLKKELNYDLAPLINLTLLVKDNIVDWKSLGRSQPQFTATTFLTINVIGSYDENPVFTESTYFGAINSDADIGSAVIMTSPIFAVSSRDNSTCTYSIVDSEDGGKFFSVNSTTGQLFVAKSLNQSVNLNRQLIFQMQATEETRKHQYSRVLVKITVNRTEDYIPIFTYPLYTASVIENMPVGTFVIKVEARAVASNERIVYSFAKVYPEFTIDPDSGVIRTAKKSTYTASSSNYTLSVFANTTTFSSRAEVYITVLQRLNTVLQFSHFYYVFNVSKSNRTIGQVKATVYDNSGHVYYKLYDNLQDTSNSLTFTDQMPVEQISYSLFTIDSSGLITRVGNSDLTKSSYMIVILAEFIDNSSKAVVARDSAIVSIQTNALVAAVVASEGLTDYAVGLIVVAIVCGILLLVVLALLVYICRSGICREQEHPPRVYIEESQHHQNRLNISKAQDPYDGYKQSSSSPVGMNSATLRKSFQTGEYVHYNDDTDTEDAQRQLCSSARDLAPTTFGQNQPVRGSDFTQFNSRPSPDSSTNKSSTSSVSPSSASQQRASIQLAPDSKYHYSDEILSAGSKSGSHTLSKKNPALPVSAGIPRGVLLNGGGSRYGAHTPVQHMQSFRSDDDYGTSSTETLVQSITSPVTSPLPKQNKVQFNDTTLDYTSSQETYTASMNQMAAQVEEEAPGITVYY